MSSASATDLQERLTPSHLIPDSEEGLRDESDETAAKLDETEPESDPRDELEFTFSLEFTDGRGKIWGGRFINRILSIRERQLVGIMRARLAGGMPFESMDPLTAEINMMMAHLMQSLKDRPKWASDMLTITNYEILQAIYMEVDSHESHFHGRRSLKEASAAQSD